jgi:hypothetical protein
MVASGGVSKNAEFTPGTPSGRIETSAGNVPTVPEDAVVTSTDSFNSMGVFMTVLLPAEFRLPLKWLRHV